tara:strand:+ start:380 stop:751 length:372 start_codon:yes stop_codon:yes gene_type:complete
MFLRESGRATNLKINLEALIKPTLEIGVPGGKEILNFAEALIGTNRSTLDQTRLDLANALGPAAVSAASAIAANFTKNDRIANGCGIPSEPKMLKASKDIRANLGLNDYRSAENTFKHFPEER